MHTPLARPLSPPRTWAHASSRAVHPSSHAGDEPLVRVIAAGLAAVSMPWELTSGTVPTERCYELLLSTDSYDAWLIHWPPGTGIEAHDHGGSTGAFAVVSGVLDEDVEMDVHTTTRRRFTPANRSSSGEITYMPSSIAATSERRACTCIRHRCGRWPSTARHRTATASSNGSSRSAPPKSSSDERSNRSAARTRSSTHQRDRATRRGPDAGGWGDPRRHPARRATRRVR